MSQKYENEVRRNWKENFKEQVMERGQKDFCGKVWKENDFSKEKKFQRKYNDLYYRNGGNQCVWAKDQGIRGKSARK